MNNNMKRQYQIIRTIFFLLLFLINTTAVKSQYLARSLSSAPEIQMDLSTKSSHYHPLFGQGDDNSSFIKGAVRYGSLEIDSGGRSNIVKYNNEEQVLYVLAGTGTLNYNKEIVPVTQSDFIYIPSGIKFGLSNPREKTLSVIVMGFKIAQGTIIKPTARLMIANADNVALQVLDSHGPSTRYQLLMGTTESIRDRLASAYQVTSLFIMDFSAGGTNKPHKHEDEEEIYLVLRGQGNIVAGETTDGSKRLINAKAGDAYFYSPNTFVGFYSGNTEGEEHARILAVRYKYPAQSKDILAK